MLRLDYIVFVNFLFDFNMSSEYVKPGKANYFLCLHRNDLFLRNFQKVQSEMTLSTEHFCTAANIWRSHKQLIAGSSNGSNQTILLIGKLGSIAADLSQERLNLRCPRCFLPQYAYFL